MALAQSIEPVPVTNLTTCPNTTVRQVFRMYANQTFADMFMTPYELNARMAEEQVRCALVLWVVGGVGYGSRVQMITTVAVDFLGSNTLSNQLIDRPPAPDHAGLRLDALLRRGR